MRDYGVAGQLGLEPTPEEYVAKMVEVFAEVRRVLRDDGTLWVNLGDCYAGQPRQDEGFNERWHGKHYLTDKQASIVRSRPQRKTSSLKPKDLVGIPWRVAFALQADGWYLRSDIIWAKPNPMPESVTDRPTKAHEYIFLLSKSERYWYDAEAIKEAVITPERAREKNNGESSVDAKKRGFGNYCGTYLDGRNKRTVWTVATEPYPEAHFATYPGKLIEPCILAGCPEGGTVLDPFAGSGTTLEVAGRLGRHAIGIELNPGYIPLIEKRTAPWREQKSLFEAAP